MWIMTNDPRKPMLHVNIKMRINGAARVVSGILVLAGTSGVEAAIVAGNSLLIDFGVSTQTVSSPDANGKHWNNASNAINTTVGGVTPSSVTNMVNTVGTATGVNLAFSSGWNINNPGGLSSPDPLLLGDLATANATNDFYYIQGGVNSATITLSNLNTSLTYNFQLFATREAADTRTTIYSITDINGTHTFNLQTSGTGAGSGTNTGNNDTLATFNGIVPTVGGAITLTVSRPDSFAYIDAAKITAVPEPGALGLVAAATMFGGVFLRRRNA
jgi:hypothetical protein